MICFWRKDKHERILFKDECSRALVDITFFCSLFFCLFLECFFPSLLSRQTLEPNPRRSCVRNIYCAYSYISRDFQTQMFRRIDALILSLDEGSQTKGTQKSHPVFRDMCGRATCSHVIRILKYYQCGGRQLQSGGALVKANFLALKLLRITYGMELFRGGYKLP